MVAPFTAHDPEKCDAVFRKDHAPKIVYGAGSSARLSVVLACARLLERIIRNDPDVPGSRQRPSISVASPFMMPS
jgi:hypothetical protein